MLARQTQRSKIRARKPITVTNAVISEWLAEEAKRVEGHLSRAFRRAATTAFLWPVEAVDLLEQNRSLTELPSIGPYIEKTIKGWIDAPPPIPDPDPLREDFLTMSQARKILATRPEWRRKLRGDLQMHTTWSDGSGTVRQMADAALELGYEYIAITDHTKGLKIAGGINETQLAEQAEEIAETNQQLEAAGHKFKVLRSTEMNLNPRGEGDMDASALKNLDLVLGSFHSALRVTEDQTKRYLAALRNPDVQILGHPRGRVYNYRIGLKADWSQVFEEAAKLDKAVEIDSYPDRQDLNISLLKLAKRSGCRISIGTDAHHPWQLSFINLGLAAALAAKIPEERILNFMPATKLIAWVTKLRSDRPTFL